MNLARLLALEMDREPFIDSVSDAETGKFERSLANQIACSDIFVQNLDFKIIADILDVEVESLLPSWGLSSALESSSTELLHARLHHTVRIHLTEELSVSSQTSLDNLETKVT